MNGTSQLMEGIDFLIHEYYALRSEILGTKERVMRIHITGLAGIPLFVAAGEKLDLHLLILVSPVVTAIFTLVLMFEQNSLMRAGRYIRVHIEKPLKNKLSGDVRQLELIGWEHFLELPDEKNRQAELYFSASAVGAFSLYYIGGTLLAYLYAKNNYPHPLATAIALIYGSAFLFCVYYGWNNFKVGTSS